MIQRQRPLLSGSPLGSLGFTDVESKLAFPSWQRGSGQGTRVRSIAVNRPLRASDHLSTVFFCVHKGASSFVANDLVHTLQQFYDGLEHIELGRLVQNEQPVPALGRSGSVVTRAYPRQIHHITEDPKPQTGRLAEKPLVILRRDPRDAAVSLYYSVAYSHAPPENDKRADQFDKSRQLAQSLDVVTGIKNRFHKPVIEEFRGTFRIHEQFPHALMTTYEDLVTKPDEWFHTVGQYIGWAPWVINHLQEHLSPRFAPPAEVDPMQHVRRISPGNWREVFDDELTQLFEAEAGDLMDVAGYRWD